MKPDTHDRKKQLAALEHNQRQTQARDDLQTTKGQDFYTRLGLSGPEAQADTPDDAFFISVYCDHWRIKTRKLVKPAHTKPSWIMSLSMPTP
jgi:hypothetical protein